MVKRSASKMRSWVWMRSTPSRAMARLANQAKLGVVSERGKRMMGTRWKVMPGPVLTPAVGEHVDIVAGVGGDPRRQLAGEILGSAHEAELGDHDGDFFLSVFSHGLCLFLSPEA